MPAILAIDEARMVFIMSWEVSDDLNFWIDSICVLLSLTIRDSGELDVDIAGGLIYR